ncbi:hypothetical protein Pse7367_0356 [Thalassoporum mexicanum PCC 7367]|uniref:DUF4359 domain-containing protein n=1 Tax=Thalassoporum mexicanum TaxID=3457544 RepID=UPI00029FD1FF|nr:DUF4359 domain-containing protein [Pseudanabaena sp. PCC 7367]AFY68667.1 hypothetical protein Pse7367_0356 [Pseudanabaena sp. PCC 7367]
MTRPKQNKAKRADRLYPKVAAGMFGLLLLAMAFTNPSKEKYINFAAQEFSAQVKEGVCQSQSEQNPDNPLDAANSLVSRICMVGVNLQRDLIKDVIEKNTAPQNFLIFTIYRTETGIQEFTTLAIFGNFFVLN